MFLLGRMRSLLKLMYRREEIESELDEEVRSYFETIVERQVERGVPEPEARRLTRIKFSHPEAVKEQVRDSRTGAAIDAVIRDLRYALRVTGKRPAFAIVTVLTLALGIGANSAIFSILSRFVLKPLAVGHPGTLLALHTTTRGECCNAFSWPLFSDLRDQVKTFSGVAGYFELVPASINGRGEPERVWGEATTPNFFDVAEAPMAVGRGFASDEERAPVTVISYGLWQRRFGSDAQIVGKPITLSGRPFTVVGVVGRGFRSVDPILDCEFWVPLGELDLLAPNNSNYQSRTTHWIAAVGRLRPGTTRKQAAAELEVLARRFAKAHPGPEAEQNLGFRFETAGSIPPRDSALVKTFLLALTAVALLVLGIASGNVANMFLAQAASRQREMAMRLALGGTRVHLLRQMLTESLLVAFGGAILGTGVALWGTKALRTFHFPAPVPLDLAVQVDWRVLLYTFLVSLGAGIALGVGSAWLLANPALDKALKGQEAFGKPGRIWSLRNLLVIGQIAMSLVLLCSAGLFLRSLRNAGQIEVGFHSRGLLMMAVDPRLHGYSAKRTMSFLDRLRERVSALPGVTSATYTDIVPLSGLSHSDTLHAVGKASSAADPNVELYSIGPDYFETVGTERIAGRAISGENAQSQKVAVVNEALVEDLFRNENPLGRLVANGGTSYRIVGVAKNVKARFIGEKLRPVLYRSLQQTIEGDPSSTGYSLMVRFQGDAGTVSAAVRREIHSVDPTLAIFNAETMEEHLRDALFLPRLTSAVFGTFGALGLALGALGLYGVVGYWVSQRTREIGIRMALGARITRVQGLIIRQGMLLLLAALAPGLGFAFLLTRLFTRILYGIAPHDPLVFAFVPVFLTLIALLACWIPSCRAAAIDPAEALRHD